jgi:hypothetical protein
MSNFEPGAIPPEFYKTTEAIAKGCTKGFLEHGAEKIKQLALRFKNKELVFIEDQETIDLVNQQLKCGEWTIFKEYVQDKRLKLLIQMGLTLRDFEGQKERTKLSNLRDKIFSRYREEGLHIAQFVQCKLLVTYLTRISESCKSKEELSEKIRDLLENLELRVTFVKTGDNPSFSANIVLSRLSTNHPTDYLVFARDSAFSIGKDIEKKLDTRIQQYGYEIDPHYTKTSIILIITKKKTIETF